MKKIIISGLITMATVIASSSAYSVPGGNGAQITQFKSQINYVYGQSCDDSGYICNDFGVQLWDDEFGPQGGVSAELIDWSTYSALAYITCAGPAFANAASVNQGNGNISVNVTLDPSDTTNCWGYNVSEKVTVNFTGQYDGNSKYSNTGTGNSTYLGTNYKYNSKRYGFSESFTGTNGLDSGNETYSGYTYSIRNTELTKEK